MGGIGKTTVAKALYDHIYHNFEAYCFMPNIKANKDNFQLLIDIFQELGYAGKITNIVKGKEVLRHYFCTKKMLIILDDVRCQKQLDDILPIDLDFTNGSRIIMTSRNWIDLRNNVKEEGKFDMPYLDNNNAMELFKKYVASNQSERKEFGLVTSQIVKACGGLPLSLKVLGSYLNKETDLKIWQQAFKKLQQAHSLDGRQNDEELWGILRISFDELAEEGRYMFLDIVCFFCTNNSHSNMMTKATALRIWDDEKCSPEFTLSTLVNMSLVQIDSDGLFVVHDQLRDMGRMISKKEYKGSRWNVEAKELTPQFLKVQMLDHNYILNYINNKRLVKLPECIEEMKSLTSLDVGGCDLDCLPQGMGRLEKLSNLDLNNNNRLVKLPKCIEEMKSLTSLDVGGCDLDCLPQGMGQLEKLFDLNLNNNKRLVKLPECIKDLKSLTWLDVGGCDLDCLPQGMGRLEKLHKLILRENKRLVKLPECIEEMKSLISLDIGGCDLDCLPQGIGRLEKLSNLDLNNNKRLVKLPKCIEEMKSLISLDFGGLKLPKCMEEMKSLTYLHVRGFDLHCLPQGMGRLAKLSDLDLNNNKILGNGARWCTCTLALCKKTFLKHLFPDVRVFLKATLPFPLEKGIS
ncbi:unnamed protein product, partial [Sphagnum compactum]